ncbi:hypothetical protein DP107_17285 [Haloglomus irregulare]|uniref:HNH domain-containing protein n=1 Tax=Haloglomus irregulare TaxID=2234134 RepID=A0A554MV68_9EURY|nr:hypothetical protein DP107_17285 [Haloglomus irregulare]
MLNLHHIVPTARGGKDKRSNAVTLCKECHKAAHYQTTAPSVNQSKLSDALDEQTEGESSDENKGGGYIGQTDLGDEFDRQNENENDGEDENEND